MLNQIENNTHQHMGIVASEELDSNREPGFLGLVNAEPWLLWAQ